MPSPAPVRPGPWQFMPYTGMKYGLTQDWWMDERLDPYKATEAAADYLQKLYGDFRDWPTSHRRLQCRRR